jgi:hypothetical protein
MTVLDRHPESPAAGSPPASGREPLPAGSPSVTGWPGGQVAPEHVWRPAPFTRELHMVAGTPQVLFGGEPIAETVCSNTAYVNEHVRDGAQTWGCWSRCWQCLRGIGAA